MDRVALLRNRQQVAWGALALGVGLLLAYVPLTLAAGVVALAALLVLVLVEPVLGLLVMLSIAPLKTLIATEAPTAVPLDPGLSGLALALFGWWGWRLSMRPTDPLPRSRVYVPVAAIGAAFALSLVHAVSLGAWLAEMLKWLAILLLVVLVLDLSAARRWQWIAFGVVLAGVLQAAIGLYEFFGGSGAPHLWISGYRFFRAFGTFGQPNPFSAFMGLTLPLALGLTWGYTLDALARRRARSEAREAWWVSALVALCYAGCSVLLLAGLVASWGRGAWLGFGAASAVMVFFAPSRRWQAVVLVSLGAIVVFALWSAGFVPASIEARIDNALTEFIGFRDVRGVYVNDDNYAIVERLAHWQAALAMADAHPLLGVGAGNYEAVYAAYSVPSWPRALGHAHNDYLNILAETGLVGLTVYLAAWAAIGWWTVRARQQHDPVLHGLALGLLGTWTHLAVHSVVDKLYVNNLFLHIGVMLGLLAVADQHRRFPGVKYGYNDD